MKQYYQYYCSTRYLSAVNVTLSKPLLVVGTKCVKAPQLCLDYHITRFSIDNRYHASTFAQTLHLYSLTLAWLVFRIFLHLSIQLSMYKVKYLEILAMQARQMSKIQAGLYSKLR